MTTEQSSTPFARTFSLTFPGQPGREAIVIRFEGEERLSQPYRFVIDFAAKETNLDNLINQSAAFTIGGPTTGRKSVYRGVVVEIEQTGRTRGVNLYRVVVMPAMSGLAQHIQSEIYIDNRHIPELIEQIFKEAGHTPVLRPKPLSWPDVPLPFVCQYQENLLQFVTRLMEREGLYYFFEETNDSEALVVACGTGAHNLMPDPLVYHDASVQDREHGESAIPLLTMRRQLLPRKVVLKNYNYQKASLGRLEASVSIKADGVGEITITDEYFRTASEGNRLGAIRAGAIQCRERIFSAESAAVGLRAGGVFSLTQHFRDDFNQQYLVTAITHQGRQSGNYLSGLGLDVAEDPAGKTYWNRMELLSGSLQYFPERLTPKPRVSGTLTAVIDGEGSGQYAEIDAEGEYKLRFLTLGKERPAGKGSCWIRMASPYGGENHGMHFPLLKGTEVMVAFRDGDPDQPFISGTLPNSTQPSVVKDANLSANRLLTAGGNSLTLGDEKDKTHATLETAKGNRLHMNDDPGDPGIDLETASKEQTLSLIDEGSKGEIVLAAATPLGHDLGISMPKIPDVQENNSKIRVGKAVSGIELSTNSSFNRVTLVADSSISLGNHSKLALGVMSSFAMGMDAAVAGGPYSRDLLWGGSEYSAKTLTRFCGQEYVNVNAKALIAGQEAVVIGGGFLPPVAAPYLSLKIAFLVGLATTVASTYAGCHMGIDHAPLKTKLAVLGASISVAGVMWKVKDTFFTAIKNAPLAASYGGLVKLDYAGVKASSNPAGGYMRVTPLAAILASDPSNLNSFSAQKAGIRAQGALVDINAATFASLQGKSGVQVRSPGLVLIEAGAAGRIKVGTSSLTMMAAGVEVNSGAIIKIG